MKTSVSILLRKRESCLNVQRRLGKKTSLPNVIYNRFVSYNVRYAHSILDVVNIRYASEQGKF